MKYSFICTWLEPAPVVVTFSLCGGETVGWKIYGKPSFPSVCMSHWISPDAVSVALFMRTTGLHIHEAFVRRRCFSNASLLSFSVFFLHIRLQLYCVSVTPYAFIPTSVYLCSFQAPGVQPIAQQGAFTPICHRLSPFVHLDKQNVGPRSPPVCPQHTWDQLLVSFQGSILGRISFHNNNPAVHTLGLGRRAWKSFLFNYLTGTTINNASCCCCVIVN